MMSDEILNALNGGGASRVGLGQQGSFFKFENLA